MAIGGCTQSFARTSSRARSERGAAACGRHGHVSEIRASRAGTKQRLRQKNRGASAYTDPSHSTHRRKRARHLQAWPQWGWHLDEVFIRINGKIHYLWRAADHEGEVLEAYVTKRRNRKAALRFLRKAMKRYGRPETIVTDKLGSYRAALRTIGNAACQETGRWLNNRAESSHQPLRRRERAMQRFRQMGSPQKFAAIHSSVHNHFNQERHLCSRETFKLNRAAALAEWRELSAA